MLNLTRKKGESLVIEIGEQTVTLLIKEIAVGAKKQVQIGVEAPKEFKVWRNEIYQAIAQNKTAANSEKLENVRTLFKNS